MDNVPDTGMRIRTVLTLFIGFDLVNQNQLVKHYVQAIRRGTLGIATGLKKIFRFGFPPKVGRQLECLKQLFPEVLLPTKQTADDEHQSEQRSDSKSRPILNSRFMAFFLFLGLGLPKAIEFVPLGRLRR